MPKLTRQTFKPSSKRPNGDEVCVVFLFPDCSSIRYLARPPVPGASVRSPWGDVWRVVEVVESGLSTYTVRCAEHRDTPGALRTQRLTEGLRELANRLADVSAQAHHKWRMRNYLP